MLTLARLGWKETQATKNKEQTRNEKNERNTVFQWRSSECKKREAKRSAPSGIAAAPPKRKCQAEFQATMLAHMEEYAGPLASLQVSGVAPIPTRCSSSPSMLGIPAASRRSSSPALHEARTLLGAGVGSSSSIRLPVMSTRAVQPKRDVPSRQPLALAEVLAKLAAVLDRPRRARSLEEEFAVDPDVATTETECTALQETRVRKGRMTLPGESCSVTQRNISSTTAVISELCEGSS